MNVLAIQSSGDQTSLCAIIKDDVVQYSINHERKDRPDWSEMFSNVGLDSFFTLDDIDIFSRLRSLTLIKGIKWPDKLGNYMKNLSKQGDIPLYDCMAI